MVEFPQKRVTLLPMMSTQMLQDTWGENSSEKH
jgi:hypothetical protein